MKNYRIVYNNQPKLFASANICTFAKVTAKSKQRAIEVVYEYLNNIESQKGEGCEILDNLMCGVPHNLKAVII